MAHEIARAQVIVDNPHAEGHISKFSFQRDWRFEKRKQDDDVYGGASGQFTLHTGTEYLEAMHCLKPAPYLVAGDMTDTWTVLAGDWRFTSPSVCSPRSTWADYHNSGPQEYGQIQSANDFRCNVALGILRDALPDDLADYPRYVSIRFNGSTEQASFRKTAFVFPYGMKSRPHPYVLDALTSEAPGGLDDSHLRAYWELSSNHAAKLDSDTRVEFIFFELIDGCMVVRHSEVDKAFVYQPYERSDLRFSQYGAWAKGTISITVYGHSAMVYCDHLTYPTSSNAIAQPYQPYSDTLYSDINDLTKRSLHKHGWTPAGNVGQLFDYDDDPVGYWATIASLQGDNNGGYAPRVTFNWSGKGSNPIDCPAVYVATLDVMSTHAAAVSAPDALEGEKIVRSVAYTLKYKGRGQTCTVVVDDPTGVKAAAWKGQNLVTVKCGFNDVTPVQKFKGYLGEKVEIKREADDVGRPRYQLDLQDPVDARLAAKFMLNRSAAGYEKLAVWLYRLLYDAGEPASSLTDILALSTGSMVDIIIPGNHGAKNLAYDFEPTVSVPDAADKVTEALGYEWGWNCETGQWFLRPVLQTYTAPPAYTLTGAVEWELSHIRSKHEFRNYLYMIAQTASGAESCFLWADQNSHMVDSASNFIGCDLWEVVKEADMWSAQAKGQARWLELQRLPSVIGWGMPADVTLGPGKYVKAQVTLMGVATDAIYRIVEERGEMPGTPSLTYKQHFVAELVQNA
ncbi:MAG TPA: hypothetical protein PLJ35_05290 [Anaerolineae bacterium]|nr:hypothetical protein [Anaerolineae bacterium]